MRVGRRMRRAGGVWEGGGISGRKVENSLKWTNFIGTFKSILARSPTALETFLLITVP